MKNIFVRSISGAVYVALIVCAIIFGKTWMFPALCCIFAILGVAELHHLCRAGSGSRVALSALDMAGAFILVAAPSAIMIYASYGGPSVIAVSASALCAYLVYFMARLVCQLYLPHENAISSTSAGLMGQLYVALPLCCASLLYLVCGPSIVLTMFIMIWLNDTGAFCVGSLCGRRRLFERISPKKSWEGFFGGLLFSIVGGVVIKLTFGHLSPGYSIACMCALGAVVSIFATWGDLVESLIKRTAHVKDSGHIMPGHGGILDRIDSLLLVAPAVVCFVTVLIIL